MKWISFTILFVVFIMGCSTPNISKTPFVENTTEHNLVLSPRATQPVDNTTSDPTPRNHPIADQTPLAPPKPLITSAKHTQNNTFNSSSHTLAIQPHQSKPSPPKGKVDPDIIVELYDPEKAMAGTTLLPDNHDREKPRIIEVTMLGEVIWEYFIPDELKKYTNPGFDVELLPNYNILFGLPGNGVYEVTRNKKIVWSYKTTKISHDVDRLPNGNTLFAFGNDDQMSDAQATEVNPKGEIVWFWHAKNNFDREPYRDIYEHGWTHTNAVTRLSNGDTLVSLRNFGLVVQINIQGEVVKVIGEGIMREQHDPELLPNGNLLFANHVKPDGVTEIDLNENIVWEFKIPNPDLWPVRDANRLSNGNTLITTATKIIEVTPGKELVWVLSIKDTSAFTRQMQASNGFYKAERITN